MNGSERHVAHVVLASVLTVGLWTVAGTGSAASAAVTVPGQDSSQTLLLARVDYTGKPPYNRHASDRQLEKSQFYRFEEKTTDKGDQPKQKPMRRIQGKPPYNRGR